MSELELPDRALRAITRGSGHLNFFLEPDGTITYATPSVRKILGYEPQELLGRSILQLICPEDVPMTAELLAAVREQPVDGVEDQDDYGRSQEFRLQHRDGSVVTLDVVGNNFIATPDIQGILVDARDVSERRIAQEALFRIAGSDVGPESLLVLVDLIEFYCAGASAAIFLPEEPTPMWVTRSVSERLTDPTGIGPWSATDAPNEIVVLSDLERAAASGSLSTALAERAVAAGFVGCWCIPVHEPPSLAPGEAGSDMIPILGWLVVWSWRHRQPLPGYQTSLRTAAHLAQLALARRRSEQRLLHLAHHDALTGAANRAGFRLFTNSEKEPLEGALLLVDLDGFKRINDELGHHVGDDVLIEVARRIGSVLREGDVLGRHGGDEFAIYLPGATVENAASIAECVTALFESRFAGLPDGFELTASIGIDALGAGASLAERLIAADQALYQAKLVGGNAWTIGTDDAAVETT